MKRRVFAVALLAISLSAGAADLSSIVSEPAQCPAGTASTSASYAWSEGHFVLQGWVCESLYNRRSVGG